MDVHYSPTGKEFVTGAYDRTIRIWRIDGGKSREVYHTKRMQRVFTVKFTGDARFIVSGSDDANVRIWKAEAAAPLGKIMPRQRAALDYAGALKKRFANMPEIKRISNSRKVPAVLQRSAAAKHYEAQKERKRLANIRAHTKPGAKEGMPQHERTKHIVKEMK
jgi:WD repeat and SOF domain-containing protein 1